MHKAPLKDRIDFYRYTSATNVLSRARDMLVGIQGLDQLDFILYYDIKYHLGLAIESKEET